MLRHNLQIAEKMEALSKDLQNQSMLPAGSMPSTSQTLAMQSKLNELEGLRKQLRTDIVEPGAPFAGGLK